MDTIFNLLDNSYGVACFFYCVSRRFTFRVRRAVIVVNAIEINMNAEMKIDRSILREIVDFIQQINYGEVVITVHDSAIVQVEKREKKRFKTPKPLDKQS